MAVTHAVKRLDYGQPTVASLAKFATAAAKLIVRVLMATAIVKASTRMVAVPKMTSRATVVTAYTVGGMGGGDRCGESRGGEVGGGKGGDGTSGGDDGGGGKGEGGEGADDEGGDDEGGGVEGGGDEGEGGEGEGGGDGGGEVGGGEGCDGEGDDDGDFGVDVVEYQLVKVD